MRSLSVLAALVGAALAACSGGGASSLPPACLPADAPCAAGTQCCSSLCEPDPLSGGAARCACAAVAGAPCDASTDCCDWAYPALSCRNGACTQACRQDGDVCTSGSSCCSGECSPGGTCVEPCRDYGGACTASAQCCAGYGCTGGTPGAATCSWCADVSGGCATDNDCCSGLDCRGSTCLAGTCSTAGQRCSGDSECCAHLHCQGGLCACGDVGHPCASPEDCCGGSTCGLDGFCHGVAEPDGGSCLADVDCALGSCPGGTPADPAVCCQDAGTSCAQAGAVCCAPSVCRGPGDGTQRCGACMPLDATPCFRSIECCSGNVCDAGRCCKPITFPCAAAGECCNGLCDLYQNGTGGSPHCCGGPGASCRLDVGSTCCDGYQCNVNGGTWPLGDCLAEPGSACRDDLDCLSRPDGSVCIPLVPDTSGPTVCSSWLDHACSAQVPCPAPLVCDATAGQCKIPAGEACTSYSSCETGTECDAGACCAHPPTTCDRPQDCCTGLCTGGACGCGAAGIHCAGPEDCCAGHQCQWGGTGNYDYACCALDRSPCTTAADCCDSNLACDGACCRPVGSTCSYSDLGQPCCNGTSCTQENKGGIINVVCK